MIYYRKHVLVYSLQYIVTEKIIKPALKPSCVSSQREEFGMSCDNFQRLDEMKVLTGDQSAGSMTANEVRAKIGLDAIEGGDELAPQKTTTEMSEMEKTEKTIQKMYDSIYSI